ncbi:hypothetical protein [Actinokineospora cianjurensis]|uniref:Peptidase inhibitor family I36 n=1 Tax=Actinokineospora cianjurensis TaxID=585224 RepID=A0A421AUY9_9PSEU|nr:hypothetical protein [Actinokineospora cianjurensis]RLK53909.1 hypothetical protein CLV68_6288 [Actinokineospora cianjurensis]
MSRLAHVLTIAAMLATATAGLTGVAAAEDDPRSGVVTNTRPAPDADAVCGWEGWIRNERTLGRVVESTGCDSRVAPPTFRYTTGSGTYAVGAVPDRQCVTTRDGVPAVAAVNDTDRIALLYPNGVCRGIAKVAFPGATYQGPAFWSLLFLSVSG